jgi:hypothetical protein
MASAKILTLIDTLVTEIDTAWTQGASDTITRKYLASVSTEELSSLTGRHVILFPGTYVNEPATRGEDQWTYTIHVLIVERFTAAGEPTVAQMDTLVDFVEATVANTIDYDGRTLLAIGARRIRTESIETETYDVEMLNEKNLFWSELTVVMKEVANA